MKENKKTLRPVARKPKSVKRKGPSRGEGAKAEPPPPPPPLPDPPRGGRKR